MQIIIPASEIKHNIPNMTFCPWLPDLQSTKILKK